MKCCTCIRQIKFTLKTYVHVISYTDFKSDFLCLTSSIKLLSKLTLHKCFPHLRPFMLVDNECQPFQYPDAGAFLVAWSWFPDNHHSPWAAVLDRSWGGRVVTVQLHMMNEVSWWAGADSLLPGISSVLPWCWFPAWQGWHLIALVHLLVL